MTTENDSAVRRTVRDEYEKYPYDQVAAVACAMIGHDYMAYDFGIDKCLRCSNEKAVSCGLL